MPLRSRASELVLAITLIACGIFVTFRATAPTVGEAGAGFVSGKRLHAFDASTSSEGSADPVSLDSVLRSLNASRLDAMASHREEQRLSEELADLRSVLAREGIQRTQAALAAKKQADELDRLLHETSALRLRAVEADSSHRAQLDNLRRNAADPGPASSAAAVSANTAPRPFVTMLTLSAGQVILAAVAEGHFGCSCKRPQLLSPTVMPGAQGGFATRVAAAAFGPTRLTACLLFDRRGSSTGTPSKMLCISRILTTAWSYWS